MTTTCPYKKSFDSKLHGRELWVFRNFFFAILARSLISSSSLSSSTFAKKKISFIRFCNVFLSALRRRSLMMLVAPPPHKVVVWKVRKTVDLDFLQTFFSDRLAAAPCHCLLWLPSIVCGVLIHPKKRNRKSIERRCECVANLTQKRWVCRGGRASTSWYFGKLNFYSRKHSYKMCVFLGNGKKTLRRCCDRRRRQWWAVESAKVSIHAQARVVLIFFHTRSHQRRRGRDVLRKLKNIHNIARVTSHT